MSIEALANMDAWSLRTTLNAVNAPPKKATDDTDLGNSFSFSRETEYQLHQCVYVYTIKHDNKFQAKFQTIQYPACCGISILNSFHCIDELANGFDYALTKFFRITLSQWKPNIQFIAVKEAEREEEYDEDDDEYYDKVIGMCDDYDYKPFVTALINVLNPTLISSFINSNSENQCDLYQAVRPE